MAAANNRLGKSVPWLRAVVAVLLWVMLGAASTVLVSWVGACAASTRPLRLSELSYPVAGAWPHIVPEDWKAGVAVHGVSEWWIDSTVYVERVRPRPFEDTLGIPWNHRLVDTRHGLPFRAMSHWTTNTQAGALTPEIEHACLSANLPWPVRLPLCPLWPGFALNTIFYAAVAWGLWQVPLALRRRRRRTKGRCTRCGYDRTGLVTGAACPECGSGLQR